MWATAWKNAVVDGVVDGGGGRPWTPIVAEATKSNDDELCLGESHMVEARFCPPYWLPDSASTVIAPAGEAGGAARTCDRPLEEQRGSQTSASFRPSRARSHRRPGSHPSSSGRASSPT